jgi:AraC-like DNA-binding protein
VSETKIGLKDDPMEADPIIPMHVLDVGDRAPTDRFMAFANLVKNSRIARRSSGPFYIDARFWQLGTMVISEQRCDAVTFDRTSADVNAHGSDHYSIVMLVEGECTYYNDGESRTIGPGGVSFGDFTMAERADTTAQHSIAIQIARPILDQAVPPIIARGPLPQSPELHILFSFCRTLVDLLPTMKTSNALRMAGVVRDLLAAALINLPARIEALPDNRVRERVIRYIATQPIGSVKVASICDNLHLTRSSLFRAFKRYGGVLAYDRRRRLHALHQALTDPKERRSLAELGLVHGFEDKAHLSRSFRKTFGYSASELRSHPVIAQRREPAVGSVQERYRSTVATLASSNFL